MNRLSLLTYTHSKCLDLHLPYFKRIEKHFPDLVHNYVACNVPTEYGECLLYDDTAPHYEQMVDALSKIPTKYVLYAQEDYILFDDVKSQELTRFMDFMDANPSILFTRLIHSGVGTETPSYNSYLFEIDKTSDYYFSTQVTIWRKDILTELYNTAMPGSIFDEPKNSSHLRYLANKKRGIGLCTVAKGSRIGGHYNSDCYPYIATAKVKGYWNMSEYPEELETVFKEYNINVGWM